MRGVDRTPDDVETRDTMEPYLSTGGLAEPPPGPVPSRVRVWDTGELPAHEQFSYWRDVICEAFTPLVPHRRDGRKKGAPGLRGWVRSAPLRSTNCAAIGSTAQRHVHGRAEVRRSSLDSVFVNLVLSGHCRGDQSGRTCLIREGEFAVFDATEPFSLDYRVGWEVLSFRVSRDTLARLVPRLETATAVTHGATNPSTAMVSGLMRSTWESVAGLNAAMVGAVDDAFAAVLAAALEPSAQPPERSRGDLDAALRTAIGRFIAANLRTGDLAASAVAAQFNISVRKLHGLYEGQELSYGRQVRKLRLEACARDLASGSRETVSLTSLAARWGYSDLSHLTRVFKAEMGCSPSEYRAAHSR